jgi:hypothetical protein
MPRRNVPISLAVLLAAGAALAGCTGSPTAHSTPTPPESARPTPTPPSLAAPVTGPYRPAINPSDFSATVDNPYFPLRAGMRWDYRSSTPDGVETTVVEVSTHIRTVDGVPCVEVHDTVRLNGEIIEDTLDWYSQQRDGTVWYFGEDTKEYAHGRVTSTGGSWAAGVKGAQPGIIMPAVPQLGDRYRQEYLRGEAEDMAEVVSLTERTQVLTGTYDNMVRTKETTPLEPSVLERKYYARGIGLVLTVETGEVRDELVRFVG